MSPLPTWHILNRETGDLVLEVVSGSVMDLALMAGSPLWLKPDEVALNILSHDTVSHPPITCTSTPTGIKVES